MRYYAHYNYPLDFIEMINEGVERVAKADVLRVAKKHLRPDELQILLVEGKTAARTAGGRLRRRLQREVD